MAALLRTVIIILLIALSPGTLAAAENAWRSSSATATTSSFPVFSIRRPMPPSSKKSLRNVGFKTFLVTNGTRQDMVRSLKSFTDAIDQDTAVLGFYAGHGIQFDQENYLIPVDQPVDERRRSAARGLQPETHNRADQPRAAEDRAVFVLDACRNNPLGGRRAVRQRARRRPVVWRGPPGRWEASSPLPPPPAMWPTDGSNGNSPFHPRACRCHRGACLPIEQVFKRVRERVVTETKASRCRGTTLLTKDLLLHGGRFRQSRPSRQRRPRMPRLAVCLRCRHRVLLTAPISPPYLRASLPISRTVAARRPSTANRPRRPTSRWPRCRPATGRSTRQRPDDLDRDPAETARRSSNRTYLEKIPTASSPSLPACAYRSRLPRGRADVAAHTRQDHGTTMEFADDPLYPK